MNINDITYQVKKQLTEADLIPLEAVIADTTIKEEQFHALSQTLGWPASHFYYNETGFPGVFYYDFPVFVEIHTLDANDSEYLNYYRQRATVQKTLYNEQEYEGYLHATSGPCQTLIFKRLFNQIPKEKQYDALRSFYTSQDHGHEQLSKEIWEKALANRPSDYTVDLPYDAVTYTIYRGGGSLSVPADKALSWTLDLMTAMKFAYRSSDGTVIHQATVNKTDIIDYFDERSEQEVIVRPQHINELKTIKQHNSMAFYTELLNNQLIDELNYYRNTFVKPSNFKMDSALHGYSHTSRVLLHALALSHLENLAPADRAVMANVAMYHDIGRSTDGVDPHHGEESVKRLKHMHLPVVGINCQDAEAGEPYTLSNPTDDDLLLIETIIRYHSKSDEVGLSDEVTSGFSPELTKRYRYLYRLFKDADGLDRGRLGDIDAAYIRTEAAMSLLVFSLRILDTLK